jgi:hypothetical protein
MISLPRGYRAGPAPLISHNQGVIMVGRRETNVDGSRAGLALGPRGRRLWAEVTAKGELIPTEVTLLEEACRVADRLERLDELLRGRRSAWLLLVPTSLDGSVVTVVAGNVLVEVRQQQTTLKGLLAELRQSRASRVAPAPPGAQPAGQPAVSTAGEVKPGVASVTSLGAFVAGRQTAG